MTMSMRSRYLHCLRSDPSISDVDGERRMVPKVRVAKGKSLR
jgi:hypothetical protein